MDITTRRIDASELAAWFDAVTTAFLDRPDTAAMANEVLPHWDLERVWGAYDGRVVGTLRSWATELTIPGGTQVPAAAISAVTVLPTHRRRGILRSMLSAELNASRARGEPLALLYASEASIYGRFGFGPAVEQCDWVVDTRSTTMTRGDASRVAFAATDTTTKDLIRDLYDRYRRATQGEIRRREFGFGVDLGIDTFAWGKAWKGWVLVHRDADGAPDGYVRYTGESKWTDGQPRSTLEIQDLIALTPDAYDDLWRFLMDIDLVSTIKIERRTSAERLPWLLTNSRAARAEGLGDGLWVALLDVPAALAARAYERPGDLVIEVLGSEPGSAVRYRLEADGGRARCAATTAAADLALHADALGAAYLGGTPLRHAVLARGYEERRPGALAEADAMFHSTIEPSCTTFF